MSPLPPGGGGPRGCVTTCSSGPGSAARFHALGRELAEHHRRHGPAAALDRFLTMLSGPRWRQDLERDLPGSLARLDRDAVTFFETDLPAPSRWRFDAERARRITSPALSVGGDASGPLFAEVRELVLRWLPAAEDVVLPGADHNLVITHAPALGDVIGDSCHATRGPRADAAPGSSRSRPGDP